MYGFWRQDDDPTQDPTFMFDLLENEDLFFDSDLTPHAIEQKGEANLHIQTRPVRVALAGRVTPTILSPEPAYLPERVTNAIGVLKELYEERQPVVLVSTYWTREDMGIKSIAISMSHPDGEFIRVNIEFEQMSVIEPEFITVPRRGRGRGRGSRFGKIPNLGAAAGRFLAVAGAVTLAALDETAKAKVVSDVADSAARIMDGRGTTDARTRAAGRQTSWRPTRGM